MVVLGACCCWSVRRGCFVSAAYTLVFYTIILMGGSFNVDVVLDTPSLMKMTLISIIASGFCVISSILLLIGLCVDSKFLLLPYLVCLFITTVGTTLLSVYLVAEANFSPRLSVLLLIDLFSGALNFYCLLCVFSQYQEYLRGREFPARSHQGQSLPVCYRPDSTVTDSRVTMETASQSVTRPAAPSDVSFVSEDSVRIIEGESPEPNAARPPIEGIDAEPLIAR